jgi:hypothetical protein
MKNWLRLGAVFLFGVVGTLTGVAAVAGASNYGVSVIAQRGFGDPANSYSWSMAWFKGKLYVGTARKQLCIENLTIDYYLPVAGDYTTNPEPGVHCPKNPNRLPLRAEIWQYTPRTGIWRMVYRSPLVRNPRARGKMVARDLAYRGMLVWHDARGRPELFVGAVTPDEFLPELLHHHPPSLLRTTDGTHFHVGGAFNSIVHNPYGVFRPMGFRDLVTWKGKLYVTLTGGLTGDGEVYQVNHPWSDHPTFRQMTPPWMIVFETHVFHNRLYVGTGDKTHGYGVYSTNGRGRRWKWHQVIADGAGRGQVMTSVVSMAVYRNWLYVGSSGWYTTNVLPSSELIRIRADGRWQVVAGNPRVYRGRLYAPISGLVDGFDNIFAAHFWRMVNYDGGLYVGTNDWSWLMQEDQQNPWLQTFLAPEYGFDIWGTCDGSSFFPVTRNAFGNQDDFGARNLVGSPFGLFIGSADHANGTTVYQDTAPACSSLVKTSSAARSATPAVPAAPAQLLADVQRGGTVLSWVGSSDASSYEVMRATSEMRVPLTYTGPPAISDGLPPEDAVPNPVPPGTPGSVQTTLTIPSLFTPIGTTAKHYFVDRTAPRHTKVQYVVVAKNAAGASSRGSNVQLVPDPVPRATFAQLVRALSGSSKAVATAANDTWRAGDRRAGLTMLARLLRNPDLDPDAAQLAYRLERQLQYAGVAGGS